jgi:SAM-dependent methyltransferase
VNALAVYDAALRRAGAGRRIRLTLADDRGAEHPLDAAAWCRDDVPGDAGLVRRCTGPTLDVGCGPGRLTGALLAAGRRPALGIDISAAAVRLARRRGVPALRRDVFEPVPGAGRWRHLLLADGNVGIGGAPRRLLRRCRELLAPDGAVHVEVTGPGTRSWVGRVRLQYRDGPVRLRYRDGASSDPFNWASVGVDDIARVAAGAGLKVHDTWTEADRWFASLRR